MSHWSYNETLCLSALLNQSHRNYPLGFDLVNVCPNMAPQRESNEPLLKEGRTAGIILVYNYMHKHTASNRLKSCSCYSSNYSPLIPLVTKLLIRVLFLFHPLPLNALSAHPIYTQSLSWQKKKGKEKNLCTWVEGGEVFVWGEPPQSSLSHSTREEGERLRRA